MFGAWMGLRRLEMAQINIATDIEDNPEEMRLLVHGKGIKERCISSSRCFVFSHVFFFRV